MNTSTPNTRTTDRTWKVCAATALAAAALLGATACQPGSSTGSSGSPSNPPQAGAAPDVPGSSAPKPAETAGDNGKNGDSGKGTGNSSGKGDGKGSGTGSGSTAATPCEPETVDITATNVDAKGAPARHLKLTALNTGAKTCTLYHYPITQLGPDAGAPAKLLEGAEINEPTVLKPGAKAYAGVLVAGGGMDEYEITVIDVTLQGRKKLTNVGEAKRVALPAGVKVLYGDDGQRVTEWSLSEGIAMRPITQR
ncbi:hypothetical protein GCM10010329_02950 [Streptomyces spiroverticillatus]|uniref:DUF4232 domain-containing protein n=1 Tax=Streptomyces finlayi TaxID=67296 RepID=A0A918WSC9_9ACTN|nr:DUF4232 domain-containing protein [Streptomyces finlayi]GGZ86515.1 hypothetical protein GCM10010329_02950 [Streptomyces spiroverticillatus]GHC78038.1 hypothetical protein GCM10010334_02930 [Streptomyces finlayi]